jgi:hypothetical protein
MKKLEATAFINFRYASCTGRFIMFSVISNIYNNKTYLNGIDHSQRKTEKVFFDN